MDKVLTIARTEFGNSVRSKGFVLGLLMLPLFYGLAFGMQYLASKADTKPRSFAVIDHTSKLYPAIERAAAAQNKAAVGPDGKDRSPRFLPSLADAAGRTSDDLKLELSDRVRKGELFAFVEIPAGISELKPADANQQPAYYSDSPNYQDLPRWIDAVIGGEARTMRYRAAHVDPKLAAQLDRPISSEYLGLVTRAAAVATTGGKDATPGAPKVVAATKVDPIRSFFVPFVVTMLIFMIIMGTAPQMLNSVIEEKMSRISEVLLGCASPFELMLGKLMGSTAMALLLGVLYLGAAYGLAASKGYGDVATPGLLGIIFLFVVLGVVMFGALYMAVGAGCSELKDAQSLMMPVMMLSMIPMFLLGAILTNPSSPVVVWISLFPTATPVLMPVRMVLSPAPPIWQVGLSVVLTLLTAVACVWAAGKILRVGLLMQGKAATYGDLAKWVMAK